ncbi:MAG: amino acid adenylation domain-containing protein [Clostridia bacterium]|nr:amino acid adenylation domain-containing protein [Clostridia bacterium]
MNYIEIYEQVKDKYAKRAAIVDQNGQRAISYGALDGIASLVAGKLNSLGVKEGDFVVINLDRTFEYPGAYLGILKLGCVVVPVSKAYPKERIEYIKNDCNARYEITEEFFDDIITYAPYQGYVKNAENALLIYTSGSTGNPKGILYTTDALAKAATRITMAYKGLKTIKVGALAPLSFIVHTMEYLAVFILGGTVHILDEDSRKTPALLYKYFEKYGITCAFLSPQLLKNIESFPKSFKRVLTGSERVSDIYFEGIDTYCLYGLSETGIVSMFKVDKKYENTPLGKPIAPIQFLICDEDGNRLEDGASGEICIKCDFEVSYFNMPSTSIVKQDDGVLLHTYDIGYINSKGDLIYVNRSDWMVKINGQRVDTLGVETRVMSIKGIENAVVKSFTDGSTYMVCYYEGTLLDPDRIRAVLMESLPSYMVPQYYVRMDSLPKNVNGKLDRSALLPPEKVSFKGEYVPPTTSLEADICAAFEEVLGCGTVGIIDDFLTIGGNSINAIKVLSILKRPDVTIDLLLEGRTPGQIAKLSEKRLNESISHMEEIPKFSPLAESQLGVYMECVQDLDSIRYNIPFSVQMPKEVDKARFIESVKEVAKKTPVFSVHFELVDGVPNMAYSERDFQVEELTFDTLKDARDNFVKPFDLENGPLCRFAYLHTLDGDYFLADIHHLIFDGSSMKPFLGKIDLVYQGYQIEEESLNLFDMAAYGREPKSEKAKKEFQTFFDKAFEGIDTDSKPLPDQTSDEEGIGYYTLDFNLPGVEDYANDEGVSPNAIFLSAFGYALGKFNGTNHSFFTTCHTGRKDLRLHDSVGMFVRTIPMPCKFNPDMAVDQFVKDTYDNYYMATKNDCIPYGKLVAEYDLGMDVSFIYQSSLLGDVTIDGKKAKVDLLDEDISISELEYMLMEGPDGYRITVHYLKSSYTEGLIDSLTKMYVEILKNMLTADKLKDIRLCNEETIQLLSKFNDTKQPYPDKKTIVELFKETVEKYPDLDCVVYEKNHYTYAQVDEITDRLAGCLRKKGVERNKAVGILIPRSEYMLICALGVLKAGGAYVPLDPSYPPERLNLMVNDSGAMMLLTTAELSPIIEEGFTGERMMIDEIPSLPPLDVDLPMPGINDLFILLYTSGSTGTPKGVMFCHSNTMVTAAWARRFYDLGPGDCFTAYASYGFDANVFDTYPAITSGATLHIISDRVRFDLLALTDYYNENKITHSVMTTQVGRQFALMGGSKYLKCLSVAGEKLTPLDPPKGFKLYNFYGPTEGSILSNFFYIDKYYKDVPIGKPTDNTKLYVVDENEHLLPPGATGELWIAGPHVTKGYLNRPEKTAQAYAMNPFILDNGYERIYKTGDVVRLLPDGNYQFVGRADGQVKVRGFRVELTEVEEIIRRFPRIKDATTAAFDDPAGGKFVAAYVVSDEIIDIDAMNKFIASEKPPYMVPAVTMQIDEIPLNRNQKVDRKALPKPERKVKDLVKPKNDVQQHIYEIVRNVIGHDQFGISTDLFEEAGLTSIATLKLNVILGKEFGTNVRLEDIKEHNTVEKLEGFLQGAKKVKKYALLEDYPITESQMGIFFEWSKNPTNMTYNIPLLLKIDDEVDIKKLEKALEKAVNAHPYLKAALFADDNGNIRAKRNDKQKPVINKVIADELPELVRPFNLLEDTLYRIAIIYVKRERFLFMDCHHIVSDGTSQAILLEDINRAYAGETIEKENYTGFEVALDEEAARKGPAYAKAKEYYDSIFTGCEPDCLPPKAPEVNKKCTKTFTKSSNLKVDQFIKEKGLTENAFFNAAFGYVLHHYSLKEDSVYTTIYNGRNSSLLASSVSMLVKTMPVLLKMDGQLKVSEYLKDSQKQLMDSMANDIYSFAEISNAYGIHSDILFAYQGEGFIRPELCGKPAEIIDLGGNIAKAPITIQVNKTSDGFTYHADYRGDMFNADLISNMIDALDEVCYQFMEKEDLKDVSLLCDERKLQLDGINDTKVSYEDVTCHKMFEDYVKDNPDQLAIIADGKSLTFDRLNRLANRIAYSLISLGVKKDTIVGIMLDRTIELDMAQLGILKAGAAFLGLLPNYPDDRVDFCLRDCDSPLIITTESIKRSRPALFSQDKPYKVVTVESLVQNDKETNPNLDISTDSLCYCIYTSGSTGRPKGVMIEHRNMVCVAHPAATDYRWYWGKDSGKVCLAISSISFDMSIMDNLTMLMTGHTVCMATDREIHNPNLLRDLMLRNHVQVMAATPSFLMGTFLSEEFEPVIQNLTSLCSGAEAFPIALYEGLKKVNPDLVILNCYGPTECSITCCCKHISSPNQVTIGRPNANTSFYVMDSSGNVLPPYALGELVISGKLVGRGYVKLPEKNKEVFFEMDGVPCYRTGDVVRFAENGEVQFFGRRDNQVKLRGFRIELDEIEKCMASYPGVKITKVIVRNNGNEDYLAGFFTAANEVDLTDLTKHLKDSLAHYMVPDALMQLDAMPLTPNGKIDKNNLPDIQRSERKGKKRAPKKSLEEMLCVMFAKALGLEECYADDNFFELGGTSLTASKVVMQLMSKGIDIEYQYIFDNPTPESLASYIDSLSKTSKAKEETTESQLEVLEKNSLEYASQVKRKPLGDVLLTGSLGFLGVHILKELLEEDGHIYCLIRDGEGMEASERLEKRFQYYFSEDYDHDKVSVIKGDITDDGLKDVLKGVAFDTLINSAACVKHYAADDVLERINVLGVKNLIGITQEKDARMIQISTVSIPGIHTDETYRQNLEMHESQLFVVDDMDNKYGISKYHAELAMFDAIKAGMDGKVIRVGNLMGRHSDGKFQINLDTNAFLNGIRGFATIGKCPISHATDPMSFSPIDLTARAIVLLSGTNRQFTAFHADNRFSFDEWQLIEAVNKCGIKITPVDDEEYYQDYYRMLGDERVNSRLSGLMTNDRPDLHAVKTNNDFTTNILYRLGFAWPFMDIPYLMRAISSLQEEDFFK